MEETIKEQPFNAGGQSQFAWSVRWSEKIAPMTWQKHSQDCATYTEAVAIVQARFIPKRGDRGYYHIIPRTDYRP